MNLNLGCVDLSVPDLLRCAFGLSKREVRVLVYLLERRVPVPISALVQTSDRDRSTIQRALGSLQSKGLVVRDQKNKPGGGYEYWYAARNKSALKRAVLDKSRSFSLLVAAQVRRW